MNKKIKKRIDTLNQRLQKLRQQLSGAKKQPDDLDELRRLEEEITDCEAEVAKLKSEK